MEIEGISLVKDPGLRSSLVPGSGDFKKERERKGRKAEGVGGRGGGELRAASTCFLIYNENCMREGCKQSTMSEEDEEEGKQRWMRS
ncbi:hypothetical protein HOLleu_06696 [Holothuria leucospilota]|uniref:Uncharacterized protein n=1 Tax=Holothuria leucospilota TaxID=206669 RepID=A0A9Q1CN99_HOLLE|nr:hypothetical protein HOLleu_06696 [Holothuria leucospilota]